ncbi:hypothetical protein VTP01DRAFT_6358 [Rhizomucor pusillus]|uniref:uncharacterized protein n=1 Tax=Rhizomucor pusillus TaxID=4840 RepID=UPI003742ED85
MADKTRSQLISDLMMLELDRQLAADRSLWPNIQGLYVLNITKRRKPKTAWYLLFQGNDIKPLVTSNEQVARKAAKRKPRVVKIWIEDTDVLNFITGGLTGIKAYMARRIKVHGDLVMAQRLEQFFEKAEGRERAIAFVKEHEQLLFSANTSKM